MQVFWYFGGKQQSSFYDSTPEVSFLFGKHIFVWIPMPHRYPWSLNSIRNKTWGQYSINNFSYANIAARIVLSFFFAQPPALPGQFAYALGKLLGGPMVDSLGGTNSLLGILLFLDLFLDRNGFCHVTRRLASQPFLFLPIRSWLPWQIFSRLVFQSQHLFCKNTSAAPKKSTISNHFQTFTIFVAFFLLGVFESILPTWMSQ